MPKCNFNTATTKVSRTNGSSYIQQCPFVLFHLGFDLDLKLWFDHLPLVMIEVISHFVTTECIYKKIWQFCFVLNALICKLVGKKFRKEFSKFDMHLEGRDLK